MEHSVVRPANLTPENGSNVWLVLTLAPGEFSRKLTHKHKTRGRRREREREEREDEGRAEKRDRHAQADGPDFHSTKLPIHFIGFPRPEMETLPTTD